MCCVFPLIRTGGEEEGRETTQLLGPLSLWSWNSRSGCCLAFLWWWWEVGQRGASCSEQGLAARALLTFWTGLFIAGVLHIPGWLASLTFAHVVLATFPTLSPVLAVTAVSRYCQMFPSGGQSPGQEPLQRQPAHRGQFSPLV